MDERHESVHLDTADDPTWQENLYFCGFDVDQNGFAVHVKLIPSARHAQIRALVAFGGSHYTLGARHELAGTLSYEGFRAENLEPFRRWELSLQGTGYSTKDTNGYMGLELAGPRGESMPVQLDVTLTTELAPIDWSIRTTNSGAGHSHYDHAHKWVGTLGVGDQRQSCSGLGIRDHSWGPRKLSGAGQVMFLALLTHDAEEHFTGVVGEREGVPLGFGFLATRDGFTSLPQPDVDIPQATTNPADFRELRVQYADTERTALPHTEILMPLLRDGYLSHDLIGTLSGGRGFSFVEVGTGLDDKATARIKQETGALS